MAFPDVPGFKGQGWSTQETMMVVRWLFGNPAAWDQAMDVARKYPDNGHTVADTLHETIVPRTELDAIVTAGGDPAKVDWLEIGHELIERRDDPKPAAVSLAAQAEGVHPGGIIRGPDGGDSVPVQIGPGEHVCDRGGRRVLGLAAQAAAPPPDDPAMTMALLLRDT